MAPDKAEGGPEQSDDKEQKPAKPTPQEGTKKEAPDTVTFGAKELNPKDAPKKRLEPAWIESLSRQELVDALLQIGDELKKRISEPTAQISARPSELAFPEPEVGAFAVLPVSSIMKMEGVKESAWRIVLTSSRPGHKTLSLEIRDDITIGRGTREAGVDLDLTPHGAADLGVSRLHAQLHPTKDDLLLVDLGSTNGTFRNLVMLKEGKTEAVKDGDTISFGNLHFKLKVVSGPAG